MHTEFVIFLLLSRASRPHHTPGMHLTPGMHRTPFTKTNVLNHIELSRVNSNYRCDMRVRITPLAPVVLALTSQTLEPGAQSRRPCTVQRTNYSAKQPSDLTTALFTSSSGSFRPLFPVRQLARLARPQ